MQHFISRFVCVLAILFYSFTVSYAGDGSHDDPFTPDELLWVSDSLVSAGGSVYVRGNFLGFGNNPARPAESPEDGDTNFVLQGDVFNIAVDGGSMTGALAFAEAQENYLIQLGVSERDGLYYYTAQEISGAFILHLNADGYAPFALSSNYRVEGIQKLTLVTATGVSAATHDFKYVATAVGGVVVGGSAQGYILEGEGGDYPVVLTQSPAAVVPPTGIFSSGVTGSVAADAGSKIYKFVVDGHRVGLLKGDNDGAEINLERGTEIYASLTTNDISELIGTADDSFLPWQHGTPTGIRHIQDQVRRRDSGVYDLTGRKVAFSTTIDSLPSGLYIIAGRKVFVP